MIRYLNEGRSRVKVSRYDTFTSVDLSRAPSEVRDAHSPDARNMIRDEYGKVRRRMGYHALPLSGLHPGGSRTVHGLEWHRGLIYMHVGTYLYRRAEDGTLTDLGASLPDRPTLFFHGEDSLYVMGTRQLYRIDGSGAMQGTEVYTPTIMIGGQPSGAGAPFEQVNLLSDFWTQSYRGDGKSADYQLAYGDIGTPEVYAWVDSLEQGKIVKRFYSEALGNLTVDRTLGVVRFSTPPPAPALAQEDNVFITANKDRTEQRLRILECRTGQAFGVNGYENQWFVSGNRSHPGYLYWSAQNDPTYFGDLQYAVLGQHNAEVVSLSAMGDRLAAHKGEESGLTYLLSPFLSEINGLMTPQVKVEGIVRGQGCIGRYASRHFGEPLFLTPLGVQALTYRDLSDTEIETVRSERINPLLLSQKSLADARSCVHRNYYLLTGDEGLVFVLDRLNPQGDSGALNNAYQYNAFVWDDIPATCFLSQGDELYFGTAEGRLMAFYTDPEDPESYQDDGRDYAWYWTLPEQTGDLFYQKKQLCHLAVRGKGAMSGGFSAEIRVGGRWHPLTECISGWLPLPGEGDGPTSRFVSEKVRLKHLDSFSLRIRGEGVGRPFGLVSAAMEIRERGKIKR